MQLAGVALGANLTLMRHHYVPQFLLRSWAETTKDNRVEVFRLDLPHVPSSRHGPRRVGYENDLYALTHPIVAGMEQQAVEKRFLSHVDNLGAVVRDKLASTGLSALTIEDRSAWARFLMSLRLRQPNVIELLRKEASQHLLATLAVQPEQYEEIAAQDDPPTLAEWTERTFPGLIENFGMGFFHELVDDPTIGDKLLRMKWWLWDFKGLRHELILADHPCIFTAGIDDPDVVIALPISPHRAFMATRSDNVAKLMRRQQPANLVVQLNALSVRQARVRVYARDRAPARFIENRQQRYRPVTR